jgi:carboxymethylenebutenolidase
MTVTAKWETVETGDGAAFDAYVVRNQSPNGHAIVMLQELMGVNDVLRDSAEMLAEEGFCVAVPDLFWRIRPHIELGYSKEEAKMAFSYLEHFDEWRAIHDIEATVRHIRSHSAGIAHVHLMGFCLGGRLAIMGASPCNVDSAISLYGVGIERHLDALTHARCPIQLHFGGRDRYVSSSAVSAIEQASAGRDIEIYLYPDASHGFFGRKRPGYDAAAADTAWSRARAFMQRISKA